MYPHTMVLDTKTMEGHGTEAMAPSTRKQAVITTQRSTDSNDGRKAVPSWESTLIFQTIDEILQLKGVDVGWFQQPKPTGLNLE